MLILVQMSIEHMSFGVMVDHYLMRCKKILVLFLGGLANPLMKEY